MSIVFVLVLVPDFTQLTTALFVTSVSAVNVVVTSILHFDTIPCAVTREFVVFADSAVFARAMEFAVYTGTVKKIEIVSQIEANLTTSSKENSRIIHLTLRTFYQFRQSLMIEAPLGHS